MAAQFGAKRIPWELTRESFDKFLRWLDEDRGEAAIAHEAIRTRLIRLFIRRGADDPETLFDMTVDRVVKKIENGGAAEYATPLQLCYGIAKNIHKEYVKNNFPPDPLPNDDVLPNPWKGTKDCEQRALCLEKCLAQLPESSRQLITRFYLGVEERGSLAKEVGGQERLRVKAFRVREKLRPCMQECMKRAVS